VQLRREEILQATIDLIEEKGLAQTRVADVANALGVSSALVFYHFKTKDALLAAAFEHAAERDLAQLDAAVTKRGDGVDGLRRVLRSYGPAGSAVGWRLWIDAWALAQREPEIQKVLRGLDDRWAAVLLQVVREGVEAGELSCPDPPAAVARISALLDGLAVATLVYRSVTRTQLRQWVRDAVAGEMGVPAERLR
jgi:AcrR family transcriptional regulator